MQTALNADTNSAIPSPGELDGTSGDFARLVYRGVFKPQVVPQADGRFRIPDVPIFECHEDRGWKCDGSWMAKAVSNQRKAAREGFLPRLIIGHNSDEPDADEKSVIGFLDNFKFSDRDGWLRADFVNLTEEVVERFRKGEFPGRSVEVFPDDADIPVVAVLGGTPPFFKLPDLRFKQGDKALTYSITEAYDMPRNDPDNPRDSDKNQKDEGNGGGLSDEMKNAIRSFIKQELQAMSKQKNERDDEQAKTPEDENGNGEKKQKNAEPKDVEKYDGTGELRQNYARLTHEHDQLKADYNATSERLAVLEEKYERQKWSAKYDALRIPKGLGDKNKLIDHIVSVPADKREEAFELYAKPLAAARPATGPNQGPVMEDAVTENDGVDKQAARAFYMKHKDRYQGDVIAAMRDFKAQQRAEAATKG